MPAEDIYREHADIYATFSERSLPNALYERPAILHLAGDVRGARVLELGCAAGALTEQLADRGADVLALDREPRLVAAARRRLGDRAQVEVSDLERPLNIVPSESVDIVVASLVLHYLADWQPLLKELGRCLKPQGALVFSIHHPITGWQLSNGEDYHRTELISEQWDWDGRIVTAHMYRRPLSTVFGQLRDAGFQVEAVNEPQPAPGQPWTDARVLGILKTKPVFLFVKAVRP